MNNPQFIELKRITAKLLDSSLSYGDQTAQLTQLCDLFCRITGIDFHDHDQAQQRDTSLPGGVAISPFLAGFCIKELIRTTRFLLGLKAAIKEAQQRFPKQRINVLYAGTGPFATLALPLCTMFASSEVGFTLLDIHEDCIGATKKLVTEFGLEPWVDEYVVADAIQYRYPKSKPLHLFVSETMQVKLDKEPQVAIMLNLMPQLTEGGICVPENITLSMAFKITSDPDLLEYKWQKAGTLFELRDHLSREVLEAPLPEYLEGNTMTVGACPDNCSSIYLMTEIEVFEGIRLEAMDCSLTVPAFLYAYSKHAPPILVAAWYALGGYPKLELRPNHIYC